jgi:hypothetical protein
MRRTIILAGMVSFIMGLAGTLLALTMARPDAAGAQGVDRVALAQQWMDLRNQGDIDAVLAMMTDNAVAAHGPCPLQNPCVGEANRSTIAPGAQNRVINMEARGSLVVVQQEVRTVAMPALGIERIVGTGLIQIPQDKISAYVGILDVTDPQTARWVAAQAAR